MTDDGKRKQVVVIQTEFGEIYLSNPSLSLVRDWEVVLGVDIHWMQLNYDSN